MSYVLSEPYATLYEEYLEYEKRGLSIQAYESLQGQTMRFLKWLEEKELALQEVKIVHAMEFKNDMAKKTNIYGMSVSQGTVCNYIKTARRFYKWLLEREEVKTNPYASSWKSLKTYANDAVFGKPNPLFHPSKQLSAESRILRRNSIPDGNQLLPSIAFHGENASLHHHDIYPPISPLHEMPCFLRSIFHAKG